MRNPFKRRMRPSGFSLIEIIFAIAMLAIGIVGILSLFTLGLSSASKSQNSSLASMEVQSLLTRILSESDHVTPVANRLVLNYIHTPGGPPGENKHEWIQFDENMNFTGSNTPVRIDKNRDLFWKCRCKPVRSDKDNSGNLVDWYPPLSPDDPFDDNGAYKDASVSLNYVNGLYEIAIGIYRSQDTQVKPGQKPIAVYTTFVTAGF